MISLDSFKKPQRYVGNEWNVVKKDHSSCIKIALCYPDLYEIGMSNVGLRIIYNLLNEMPQVLCERVFMPGLDMSEYLTVNNKKLFSLESKTSIDQFEVLGVNLNHELNYTNFLSILALSGITLQAKERKDMLVVGGGVVNPEPLARFVDVFFLGEFEEKASEFIDVLKRYRDKQSRLKALGEIEGFYIPSFYEVRRTHNTYVSEKIYHYAHDAVKKVHVKDLNKSFYPLQWLTPYTSIIHDRAQIEIARGCPHKCHFCQARACYFPYREKSIAVVLEQLKNIYRHTGYENFSLLALSASDYSGIEHLIEEAADFFQYKKVGVSLPSLRLDDVVGRLHKRLLRLKKTSLTLAIEAATPRLRDSMNKHIDINSLWEAQEILSSLRLRHIKLYFMFGLPQENDDDVLAICELINELRRRIRLRLNVSINAFVPKPFSYFQNVSMETEETLTHRRRLLIRHLTHPQVNVSVSCVPQSMLEGIFSRGDRELSAVLERAYKLGARFDSYREYFRWDIWQKAFAEEGIEWRRYLESYPEDFSWSHIQIQ